MITTSQIVATVAAFAVAGWPQIKHYGLLAGSWLLTRRKPVVDNSAAAALDALIVVVDRLKATGDMTDERQKAVELLTLALVAGHQK